MVVLNAGSRGSVKGALNVEKTYSNVSGTKNGGTELLIRALWIPTLAHDCAKAGVCLNPQAEPAVPACGGESMHCYADDACRKGIAANAAADSGVSCVCEAGEAKETGDEERKVRRLSSRPLNVSG